MNLFSLHKELVSYLVILPLSVAAVTSCGHAEEDIANQEDSFGSDGISISIALSGIGETYTRSAGEDSDDEDGEWGTADENYININDLYVMTFTIPDGKTTIDADSELIEFIWPNTARSTADADGESYVSYSGSTAYLRAFLNSSHSEYKDGKYFCIVAIANIKDFSTFEPSEITTFSDLQSLTYTYKVTSSTTWAPDVANGMGIPMFGVKKVSLSGYDTNIYNADNPYPLVSGSGNSTLWMLRAFAKVEIDVSNLDGKNLNGENNVDVNIVSASIAKYQSQFTLIPDLNRMQGFSTTGGTGQVISGPDETTVPGIQTEGSELKFKVSDDGNTCVAYLPEYVFSETDTERPKISLQIQIGDNLPQEFEFYLKRYSDSDDDCDNRVWWLYLLRNHCYRFAIDVNFNIISVIPNDWEDVHNNEFTFGDGQVVSSVSPWEDEIDNKIEL